MEGIGNWGFLSPLSCPWVVLYISMSNMWAFYKNETLNQDDKNLIRKFVKNVLIKASNLERTKHVLAGTLPHFCVG